MQPLRRHATTDQSAAFALFEALRQAQGLAALPDGTDRATFLRVLDPAVAGLAWTSAEDDALQMRWSEAPAALGESFWVHAAAGDRGCTLSVYLHRDRPTLALRFGGASFVEEAPGRFVLRERLTHSSHDGHAAEREAIARALAKGWKVPMDGAWLRIGTWDATEGAWEPETDRRLLAVALIAEAARRLEPDWAHA
jgi:hypothetical protein